MRRIFPSAELRALVMLLLCAVPGTAEPTIEAAVWLPAYQAYLARDYAAAHAGFVQVLERPDLAEADRSDLLWCAASCLQALGRPEDALPLLEALTRVAPTSPYLVDGRAMLLTTYLARRDLQRAEAVWREGVAQWQGTRYLAPLVTARLLALLRDDPAGLEAAAAWIAVLPADAEVIRRAVYQPLLQCRAGEAAHRLHTHIQRRSAGAPAQRAAEQAAYHSAITEEFVDATFASLQQAIREGDLAGARVWLDNLNLMVPEHPRAVAARQLYREQVTTP